MDLDDMAFFQIVHEFRDWQNLSVSNKQFECLKTAIEGKRIKVPPPTPKPPPIPPPQKTYVVSTFKNKGFITHRYRDIKTGRFVKVIKEG